MQKWGAPPLNHVYADVKGNIAWLPRGLTPKRPNWDGLLPVPGDGRYEWQGFVENDQLPRLYRPEQGFFATANQMNLPGDYPVTERKVGDFATAAVAVQLALDRNGACQSVAQQP